MAHPFTKPTLPTWMPQGFELAGQITPTAMPHFIPLVSESYSPRPRNFYALGSLLLGICRLQLFLYSPVKSWCFQVSLIRGFPFSLCTTYTLKSPLFLQSWQSFICPQQCFKHF